MEFVRADSGRPVLAGGESTTGVADQAGLTTVEWTPESAGYGLADPVMSGCSAACPAKDCTGGWCNKDPGHGGQHRCGTCGHTWY